MNKKSTLFSDFLKIFFVFIGFATFSKKKVNKSILLSLEKNLDKDKFHSFVHVYFSKSNKKTLSLFREKGTEKTLYLFEKRYPKTYDFKKLFDPFCRKFSLLTFFFPKESKRLTLNSPFAIIKSSKNDEKLGRSSYEPGKRKTKI